MSSPLAAKTPQSLAANSGNAVIVKPALEILALTRRSWASVDTGKDTRSPMKTAVARIEGHIDRNRFLIIVGLLERRILPAVWTIAEFSHKKLLALACMLKTFLLQF
jgi:hypothetical protein